MAVKQTYQGRKKNIIPNVLLTPGTDGSLRKRGPNITFFHSLKDYGETLRQSYGIYIEWILYKHHMSLVYPIKLLILVMQHKRVIPRVHFIQGYFSSRVQNIEFRKYMGAWNTRVFSQ